MIPRPTQTEPHKSDYEGWTLEDFAIASLAQLTKLNARLAGRQPDEIDAPDVNTQQLRDVMRNDGKRVSEYVKAMNQASKA